MRNLSAVRDALRRLFLERRLPYAWIAAAAVLLYLKTLAFRLTEFDDRLMVLENFWFHRDPGNIFAAFAQSAYLGSGDYFYRPLVTVTLMLDAWLGGTTLAVYHATNILIHAAASCLVFALLRRLCYASGTSFFLSLFFAVHPVLAQSAAWIPGRYDALLGLCTLLSLLTLDVFRERPSATRYAAHLLCFGLALFTKETSVLLAPLLLVYLRFVRKDPLRSSRTAALLAGWVPLLLLFLFLRSLAPLASGPGLDGWLTHVLATGLPTLAQYAGKALLPFNLSAFPVFEDISLAWGAAALALTAFLLARSPGRDNGRVLFGALVFVAYHLPPLALPDSLRVETRMYVPLLGVLLVLAETDPARALRLPARLLPAAGGIVIAVFAVTAFLHSDTFIGGMAFWQNAAATSPHSSTAHNNLAVRHLERGEYALSERELLRALELAPGNANARINLAAIHMERGTLADAGRELELALALRPEWDTVHYNIARLRCLEGRLPEAAEAWRNTLELNPNHLHARRMLAAYAYATGDAEAFQRHAGILAAAFGHAFDAAAVPPAANGRWFYDFSGRPAEARTNL